MWSLYCDLSATLWKWSSELLILRTNIADKHSTITGTGIGQQQNEEVHNKMLEEGETTLNTLQERKEQYMITNNNDSNWEGLGLGKNKYNMEDSQTDEPNGDKPNPDCVEDYPETYTGIEEVPTVASPIPHPNAPDIMEDCDAELVEDQTALDNRQQLIGDALPSVVQFDSLESRVYQCAPGENNIPQYILLDNDFEVLAFPDLFPYGKGAYHSTDRSVNLPIRKYFQQRLLNVDGRFAKNMEYIFCAQYISDIKQIQSDANLAIRLTHGRTLSGQNITAGLLRNPTAVKQLVRTEQAYKFLKNVRGSPAYWQNELYDVLAMLRSLGIPTWFLTLSAADLHWPEMIQAVAAQFGRTLSQQDVLKMSIAERSKHLRENPVTGVRMFQHRVEGFFSQYILSDAHPLGIITDHVIKIEFQMRGTPHAHCLLWAKNAPKLDRDTDDAVCTFIDKYITATLPDISIENEYDYTLMKRLQKHSHSDYCRRNRSCHFAFPKAPSTLTLIARPPKDENPKAIVDNAKKILEVVQHELSAIDFDEQNVTLEDILKNTGLDIDTYMEALHISPKRPSVVLKRSPQDIYINACNRDILHLWGGNVDLQYVLDEIATVMYVCSYMTKGEKAMGETLKRVAKESRNDDIKTQMNKIKKEFPGKRVLGLPESAMRILSMWLMKKSRKVTPVNTNMKDEHVSLPKTHAQLSQLHDDDENVFATNLIDCYAARPHILKDMCLATFAVNYDVDVSSTINDETEEIELSDTDYTEAENVKKIHLKNGLGVMRQRRQEAILRTKRYKVHTEPEKYYHAKLLLYYPWETENDLIAGFSSYQESYRNKQNALQQNSLKFNDDCKLFRTLRILQCKLHGTWLHPT